MSPVSTGGWTAGVVGLGVVDDEPVAIMTLEERDAACTEMGHPGVTYSPSVDRTWCICGESTYLGDVAQHGLACCGGPLDRYRKDTNDA